jgi:hypothetical protein
LSEFLDPHSRADCRCCDVDSLGSISIPHDLGAYQPPAHLLDSLHVHDNLICATRGGGHPTGVAADNGANLAVRDITFAGNTIQSGPCR